MSHGLLEQVYGDIAREELNKIELSYFRNMFAYAKSHAPMYTEN